MEVWKDIEGCDGLFQASNEGRIKRTATEIVTKNGIKQTYNEKIYSPWKSKDGYLHVCLPKRFHKTILVHKLVAETWIPIPEELKQYIGTQNLQVNHKDENKENNRVENLEFCTAKYNSNYGSRNEKMGNSLKGRKPSANTIKASVESCRKEVYQYTKDLKLMNKFESIAEAVRHVKGTYTANIVKCCHGINHTCGGYKWSYEPL